MPGRIDALSESARVAAGIGCSISRLFAVATLDWCEQAAECFAPLAPGGVSGVLIASVSPDGGITNHEATGVAFGPESGASSGAGHVTSVLDRLESIGWDPEGERLSVGVLGELRGSAGWREGPLASAWHTANWVVCGLMSFGRRDPARSVVVYVASPDASEGAAEMAHAELAATLPLLAERAWLAIGDEAASAGGWLTAREQQVLEQLALGLSVREIAERFERSPYTVHDHVKSLHRKLGASTRGGLVARALGFREQDEVRETKPNSTPTGGRAVG